MAWAAQECGEMIDPHTAIGLHAARAAELPGDYDAVAAYVAEHATPSA